MKQHPATKFKRNYPQININTVPQKEIIGKRSGLIIKSDSKTGLDFLLQDNFTVKSNCTTLGQKTQTMLLQETCDDYSSSSSDSDSNSESLSILSTEKEDTTNNNQQSLDLNTNSNLNEPQINIKQCAEDLLCPTNYDIEDKEGSKLLERSRHSVSRNNSQQNDSSIISMPKFKTKEEIEMRYKGIEKGNKNSFNENEHDALTIQGLSSIQKGSNFNDNSIIEETNLIKTALDEPKKRKAVNKTIYEETEEELTKNCPSQTCNKEKKEQNTDNQLDKENNSVKTDNNNNNNNNNEYSNISENLTSPILHFSNYDNVMNNKQVSSSSFSVSIKNQPSKSKSRFIEEKANKRKQTEVSKDKESKQSKPQIDKTKKLPKEKELILETQYMKQSYQMLTKFRSKTFDVSHNNNSSLNSSNSSTSFGINNRYSLRMRVPRLNHLMGERIKYIHTKYGDEVSQIISCRVHFMTYLSSYQLINTKHKLYKPLQELKEDFDELKESNAIVLSIKPHCKKSERKNDKKQLVCEIKESQGNNWFIINEIIYKNQKTGKRLIIPSNASFEIRNYSNNELVIQLYSE